MAIKLSSHFAGNKVTLFDFQLAEHMNKQFKVTQKWFSEYPLFSSAFWATFKIFAVSFVLFSFALQLATHWGNFYPSAAQRGEKPQAAHYRPLLVNEFDFFSGGIRSEREVELYAKAFVEDYAFKRTLFTYRNMW